MQMNELLKKVSEFHNALGAKIANTPCLLDADPVQAAALADRVRSAVVCFDAQTVEPSCVGRPAVRAIS
jgi:hypothetical protein